MPNSTSLFFTLLHFDWFWLHEYLKHPTFSLFRVQRTGIGELPFRILLFYRAARSVRPSHTFSLPLIPSPLPSPSNYFLSPSRIFAIPFRRLSTSASYFHLLLSLPSQHLCTSVHPPTSPFLGPVGCSTPQPHTLASSSHHRYIECRKKEAKVGLALAGLLERTHLFVGSDGKVGKRNGRGRAR